MAAADGTAQNSYFEQCLSVIGAGVIAFCAHERFFVDMFLLGFKIFFMKKISLQGR